MTKRERIDGVEPEAEKREKLHHEFAEVQTGQAVVGDEGVPIARVKVEDEQAAEGAHVKEEKHDGDEREAQSTLVPKVELQVAEAQYQLGAEDDEGNDSS